MLSIHFRIRKILYPIYVIPFPGSAKCKAAYVGEIYPQSIQDDGFWLLPWRLGRAGFCLCRKMGKLFLNPYQSFLLCRLHRGFVYRIPCIRDELTC